MTKGESRQIFLRHVGAGSDEDPSKWADLHDFFIGSAVALVGSKGLGAVFIPSESSVKIENGLKKYPLPVDFLAVDCVWLNPGRYALCDFYSIADGSLCLPIYFNGNVEADYRRKPAPVAPDAPDSEMIDLPDDLAHLVPLRCAAMATQSTNPELSAYLMDVFAYERAFIGRSSAVSGIFPRYALGAL